MASPNTIKLMQERAKMRAEAQLPPQISPGVGRATIRRVLGKTARKVNKRRYEEDMAAARRAKQIEERDQKRKELRKPSI